MQCGIGEGFTGAINTHEVEQTGRQAALNPALAFVFCYLLPYLFIYPRNSLKLTQLFYLLSLQQMANFLYY
jgi:hypothetical protein